MFYSHQLLARKAPLGQIWMAATLHAKINRRKLDKLNIIKICEEILNPSIPMALRLSGILMGGVVIVYERKVKLLYEDVTRLLMEINEAWKVKSVRDPTMLPKRKIQAKKEKITLPYNQAPDAEVGDIESLLDDSNANATMNFQHTAYFAMRLDNVDEPYINDASKDGEFQNFHQADAANITLFERFDSFQTNGHLFNHFERFDIEGEESNMNNTTTAECTQITANLEASPPPPEEPQRAADEIHDQHPEDKTNQPRDGNKEISQLEEQEAPARKKARRVPAFKMDYEQTMIPGRAYQTWLQDAGDIVSKRGRKRKRQNILSTMKLANLMDLPSLVLICGLVEDNGEVHYPEALMELWIISNQPPHDSPSGRTSPPRPPEPSMSSPPHGAFYNSVSNELPFGDIHNGVGLESFGASFERLRTNIEENVIPAEILMNGKRTNLTSNGLGINEPGVVVTPGNSGDEVRSIPSAGSGYGLNPHDSEVNSLRSSKRQTTSSKHSSGGLEPVRENLEEHFSLNYEPKFKLSRLSENGSNPEQELLVETGPTQTPIPPSTPHGDQLTETIKTQMKLHFETPGAPEIESVNKLAKGMNRKGAALLFYQTCVLATLDVLKVEQKEPYADILISKGAKM